MKIVILNYLENFWQLLGTIAPYIIIGIFLAGFMKLVIPQDWIRKHLGGKDLSTLFKTIILGIPLPLCSCSVIPFVSAMRRNGASKSSTIAFLISTPITGADSIVATYGVLGWFFTIYRVISSIFIAILAGILSIIFDRDKSEDKEQKSTLKTRPLTDQTISFSNVNSKIDTKKVLFTKVEQDTPYSKSSYCQTDTNKNGFINRIYYESVYKIFGDFAKAMLIGIALGALVVTLIPEQFSTILGENLWLNYLLILLISAPLYICATSSIPIGVALLSSGFSTGAVFILLTAGPATSTITMSVVLKLLGKRSLFIYLISVIIGSLLFAWLFDTLFIEQASVVTKIAQDKESLGFIENISALIVLAFSWKNFFSRSSKKSCCGA